MDDNPQSWRSILDADCERCASAKWEREHAPFQLPKRAVSYSFTGEFAHTSEWWSINLADGEITKWEWVKTEATGVQTKLTHPGVVEAGALANLRAAAVKLWRSDPPPLESIMISPGVEEYDEVISGQRLVPFQRYDPKYGYIVAAIESALPADAAKASGSFIIPPRPNAKVPPQVSPQP
jgi:hypothetical protein